MTRILVVEDEAALRALLSYTLERAGHQVETCDSAEAALGLLAAQRFDLAILDWRLPGESGLDLCRMLRATPGTRNLPLLMLTARGEEPDRIDGLAAGADDYVTKPFSLAELQARVRALLRRAQVGRRPETMTAGDLSLDRAAHRVTRSGREIRLGPTEFRLLLLLMESRGRVLSRRQLIDGVWGNASEVQERTVDVHIGRLRKALVRGSAPDPIRTVRGDGYRLAE